MTSLVTGEKIEKLWSSFREGGNLKGGLVTRDEYTKVFDMVFESSLTQKLMKDMFFRFQRSSGSLGKHEIYWYDLLIAFTILSTRLRYDAKVKCNFDANPNYLPNANLRSAI